MAGGSLSLSGKTRGQDVISMDPQITFFKKVYKRHTNFGIETTRQTDLTGGFDFGSTNEIRIEKKGSLITDMHFEFTLPPAAGDGGTVDGVADPTTAGTGCVDNYDGYARWVNAVGFAIINKINLKFGSNIIDTHTGLWYDVWNELTDPNRKEWSLVGKYDETTRIGKTDKLNSRYYIPLKFYFNRNPGLAIPIFMLDDKYLKIDLVLNSRDSLLLFSKQTAVTPVIQPRSIINPRFYATYVFLEPYEESRIKNSLPSEYLAETLDIHENLTTNLVSSLVFENPTKELIWVFRHPNRIAVGSTTLIPESNNVPSNIYPNDIFNYSRDATNNDLTYGTYDPFNTLKMSISGKQRFEITDATYFRTIQPYKYHSNVPGGINKNIKKQYIYVYSFALQPENYQPSGSFNFSINDDKVNLEFVGPAAVLGLNPKIGMSDYDLTIFSVRYEYIEFNFGRVSVKRVPVQTSFQEAREETLKAAARDAEAAGGDAVAVAAAVATAKDDIYKAGKASRAGVNAEIKRRYAVEVPYTRDQSLGKKKWSGLQGDYFQTQKDADLGKDSETKKKDIF
jgi:hypothetical protein